MRVQSFVDWLRDEGYPQNQIDSHVNRCGRVELAETVDLDNFREERLRNELLGRFSYSVEDERCARPQRHHVVIDGNVRNGTASLRSSIRLYWQFYDGRHRLALRRVAGGNDAEGEVPGERESYREFLQAFHINEDEFGQYGMRHSIFAAPEQAREKTEALIRALTNDMVITIRKDSQENMVLWRALYEYLFGNHNVQFDGDRNGDGNKVPRDELVAATHFSPIRRRGYTLLQNYVLSHVFDCRTMNPLLFGNTCNFAFTPTIVDPLTGLARGEFARRFRVCFRAYAYDRFQESYAMLNEFMDRYVVCTTGHSIRESILAFRAEVPPNMLQKFIARAIQQWSPILDPREM